MLFDWNGRKNKTIRGLFDNNLETKMNLNVTNEDAYMLPYRGFVVLPNIYNNFRIDYYDKYGSGTTLNINLYSSAKTMLGSFTLTTESFDSWKTVSGTDGFSNVRFLEVTADNNANFESGIYELKLYGDIVSAAVPIFPTVAITPVPDWGKYAHSINILDDRYKRKDGPAGNGVLILPLLGGSTRNGVEAAKFDRYPEHYNDPSDGTFWLGRNGSDNLQRRIGDPIRDSGMKVNFYRNGGSLKDLSAVIANNNTGYIDQANPYFRIVPGGDKEVEATWQPLADLYYKIAAIFGSNPNADMTGITVTGATGADALPGQRLFSSLEIGNEDDKDWQGPNSYLTPRAKLAKIWKVSLAILAADPDMEIWEAAETYMNNEYFRAMGFINFWERNNTPLPIKGFKMNLYMNSDLDGQGGSGTGVSPEFWDLKGRLIQFKAQMDEMFPNKLVDWSEYGYAADVSSPWYSAPIGSKTSWQVAADWSLRAEAICQSVRFIPRMNYYAFFQDSSYAFDSMSITQDHFNNEVGNEFYINTDVRPIGYALANKFYLEKDYNWFTDELIHGGTTGKHVRRKSHAADPNKKLFKVWMGTANGSTLTNELLDIGANATAATLYSLRYDQWTPSSVSLSITGTTVTIPTVEEGMKWVEVTYSSPSIPSGMSTITALKNNHNTVIRTETVASGITTGEVADQFDNIADELLARGIKVVADTTALSAESGADFIHVLVIGNGIFKWASSGTPNGTTIFAATGGGVYNKVLDVTGADPTAINNLTSNLNDLELGGAPIQPAFPATTAGSTINWSALDDTSHKKLQYGTVTGAADGTVEINYDATKEKAVTLIAAPDEQCAKALLFIGASVGVSKANVYIYRPQVYGGELIGNGTTGWNKSGRIGDLDLSVSGSVIKFNIPDSIFPTPVDYEGVAVHFQSSDVTRYGFSVIRKVSGLGAYNYGFEIYDRSGAAITTFPTTDRIIITTPCLKSVQVRADVIDSNGANNFNYKILSNLGGGGVNFWAMSIMKK